MTIRMTFLDVLHPTLARLVREEAPAGWEVTLVEEDSPEARVAATRNADFLFLIGAPATREVIEAAPRLRLVQKLGAGVDNIDLAACRSRGIPVARAAGSNAVPVAEHTLMLILACLRRLPLQDRATRQGIWRREQARSENRQITGKCLGIVGMGAIGRAVTKLLAGFRCEIIFHDPDPTAREVGKALGARHVELDDLFRQADIVSLHLPLLPETAGLVNRERIAMMKPGAILINCARGRIVDEDALHEALQSGHLGGAGIDTFAEEPVRESPLLHSDSTVVTPHIAAATVDNFLNIVRHGYRNATTLLNGGQVPEADLV